MLFGHTKFAHHFRGLFGMKKLLACLFFTLVLFNVFASQIFAQSVTPSINVRTSFPIATDPGVPQDFHTYSQNVFIEILTSISCMLTGNDPLNPTGKCLGINPLTHKLGYVASQGGAVGIVGNMISMTFNIPVSSTTYAKDLASNFGISKTSYATVSSDTDGGSGSSGPQKFAEGYGYTGLQPVLAVWKIFRNLVYLLLVLLFIIIGLGIMFRLNIDARSVMSIQNQLPKIVIGVILITFSYAIAGFIVDLMYVFMYLIYYIFTQQTLGLDMGGLNPAYLQGTSPLGAIGGLSGASDIAFGVSGPVGHILASLFDNNFGRIIATIVGGIIGGGAGALFGPVGILVGGIVGIAAGGAAGSALLGVIGGLLAYIVITITIIWSMLRLWFLLLRSYLFFLIDVILAPFWIGLGLVPKASAGFNTWLRDIIANLAVFPATLFILLLGKILVTEFGSTGTKGSFVPPLIGNPGDASSFGPIIGLGIILLLPNVATMVRETLKAPGFKYTQAIGASLGQGQKIAGLIGGKAKEAVWKTNSRTGAAEGFKLAYQRRVQSAFQNSKLTKKVTGAKEAVARNIPFVKGKNKRNQSRRAMDNIQEEANKGNSNYVGANSKFKATTAYGGKTVKDLGNGMYEVMGDHGVPHTVRAEDMAWDRMATPSAGPTDPAAATGGVDPVATAPTPPTPTRVERIQTRLDQLISREASTPTAERIATLRGIAELEIDNP